MDADKGALIGNITGLKQDHGVAVAHEFGRGFITDGAQGKVIIFDLKTLKVTGDVNADKDADCVIYDPASKRVFAMNGDPHSSTVIAAKSGTVVGTIELGGAPEFAVADGKGTVYVNMEDKNELVAIDSHALTIKSRWPVAPTGAPTALAMDITHRRLFSAGRNPQMLVVMDADGGKVIQSFPISAGVDAAAYEPETGLLFASTREGMIHIFHEDPCHTLRHTYAGYTRKGNTLYVHVHFWPAQTVGTSALKYYKPPTAVSIGGLLAKVKSARMFVSREKVDSVQDDISVKFTGLPTNPPDYPVTVIEVQCDSEPAVDHTYVRKNRPRRGVGT